MLTKNRSGSLWSESILEGLLPDLYHLHISQVIDIIEEKRLALLHCLDRIPCYGDEHGPSMEHAFVALKAPRTDCQSCLQIVKTYLCTSRITKLTRALHKSKAEMKDIYHWLLQRPDEPPIIDGKENIIRWIVTDALERDATFFGNYAEDLYQYFLFHSYLLACIGGMQARMKAEERLLPLKRGQVPNLLHKDMADVILRLKKHQPVVFATQTMGLGDIIMSLPAIQDVAHTFAQLLVGSPLRLVVPSKLAPMIQYLMNEEIGIEVYTIETKDANLFTECLECLAYPDMDVPENVSSLEHVVQRKQGGTVLLLGFRGTNLEKITQVRQESNVYFGAIDFMNTYPYSSEDTSVFATTYRRSMQRSLSTTLGIKIYDDETRDNIDQIVERMERYLVEYVQQSSSLQKEITELKKSGFENGYICCIEQGTIESKRLTADLFAFMLDELADFCRQHAIGILLIKNQADAPDAASTLSSIAYQKGLAYHEVIIREDIAYTLVFLREARGVIGPDTFLTHAAEFISSGPVLDILSNSNGQSFRLSEHTYLVEHVLAKGVRWDSRHVSYEECRIYTQEFTHPFTILSNETRAKFHYLIQSAQDVLVQRLRESLAQFCAQIFQ